jgi:sugar/nucleoside kinase (ribokinase family)
MPLIVLGSIALDTVKTPLEERADLLGGSASYASVAASFFSPVKLVGIVGEDFPAENIEFFKKRSIDLEGLQVVPGKTFRWSGEYMWDMNQRETRLVELNVFENFSPELPESYRPARLVLLGNIAPALQNHVLDQLTRPHFVIADTMDLWINIAKEELLRLIVRVDMLILNDGEARELTGETSLIKAGRRIRELGPAFVAIKKGEHGCLLFGGNQFFSCPAYPLEDIHDPTGAGDCFAGGVAGYLASRQPGSAELTEKKEIPFELLKQAVVAGSVLASFNVESFSMDRLREVTHKEIAERFEMFRTLSHFEVVDNPGGFQAS